MVVKETTEPKEEPEEPEDPDDEPEEPEDPEDDLEAKIEKVLNKVLPKFLKKGTGSTGAPKRPSYRDEEDSMLEKVEKKVDELLSLEKTSGEKHDEPADKKADPEPVPAAPRRRRVESAIWG